MPSIRARADAPVHGLVGACAAALAADRDPMAQVVEMLESKHLRRQASWRESRLVHIGVRERDGAEADIVIERLLQSPRGSPTGCPVRSTPGGYGRATGGLHAWRLDGWSPAAQPPSLALMARLEARHVLVRTSTPSRNWPQVWTVPSWRRATEWRSPVAPSRARHCPGRHARTCARDQRSQGREGSLSELSTGVAVLVPVRTQPIPRRRIEPAVRSRLARGPPGDDE